MLLLDDLHWADTGSLHLLRFLLPSLATRPVLVVCGWRDHEVVAGSDRDLLAAEIAAAGESWPLAGLGADDVAALIAATGGQHVGPDEAAAVAGRTSGNPLFVSEMARLAAARGAAVSEMVPETAQGAIRRRVARLPQPAQHVLTVAAVLGPGGRARPGPHPGRRSTPTPSWPVSTPSSPAGWRATTGDRLALSHALVRDAVYDATPAARRRELHLAAADVPGLLPAEVAGHLLHARAARRPRPRGGRHRGGGPRGARRPGLGGRRPALPAGPRRWSPRDAERPATAAARRRCGPARRGRPRGGPGALPARPPTSPDGPATPAAWPRRRWGSRPGWAASRCGSSTASRTTCSTRR